MFFFSQYLILCSTEESPTDLNIITIEFIRLNDDEQWINVKYLCPTDDFPIGCILRAMEDLNAGDWLHGFSINGADHTENKKNARMMFIMTDQQLDVCTKKKKIISHIYRTLLLLLSASPL